MADERRERSERSSACASAMVAVLSGDDGALNLRPRAKSTLVLYTFRAHAIHIPDSLMEGVVL